MHCIVIYCEHERMSERHFLKDAIDVWGYWNGDHGFEIRCIINTILCTVSETIECFSVENGVIVLILLMGAVGRWYVRF